MIRHAVVGLFLVAVPVTTQTARAQTADRICRDGGFSSEQTEFGWADVQGKGQADLLNDMNGCPNRSDACHRAREGYVLPGDKVLTGLADGDFVCAYYHGRVRDTAGWIESSRLHPIATDRRPALPRWAGSWSDGVGSRLRITIRNRTLHVWGEAYWPGPTREKDWPSGWPHSGSIDGEMVLTGNLAHYADTECQIDMHLVSDALLVSDNGSCGGVNVRFNSVYQREKRKAWP